MQLKLKLHDISGFSRLKILGLIQVHPFHPTLRGPDFFVVLGTERKPLKSWVVWEEDGKHPNLIIEIFSSTTAATDWGLKKQIFQDIFRTPDYFWFDPDTLEFQGFHLLDGQDEALESNIEGRLWSQQLELYLGIHDSKL